MRLMRDTGVQLLKSLQELQLKSMHLHPLSPSFLLLLLLVAGAAEVCVALTSTLHGFRGCAVREFSFVAQKPGCKGLRISTEACWGRCHTWEKPVPDAPYIHRHHRVCTYSRIRHMTARLPGCQPNVSPLYHYPMALHCHCAACSTQDTESSLLMVQHREAEVMLWVKLEATSTEYLDGKALDSQ
ncbi:Glycoprotein hormone beta-5 [Liparis tanakae]|uniref:Glycoprotein hormone beta-5 n=1 Tax=Liparis tanakae TaxID=230148 RepID=A0A4Z2J4X6_9TELE|nr:Glycoprotein hormone beta-5 [Liparis tanakae]